MLFLHIFHEYCPSLPCWQIWLHKLTLKHKQVEKFGSQPLILMTREKSLPFFHEFLLIHSANNKKPFYYDYEQSFCNICHKYQLIIFLCISIRHPFLDDPSCKHCLKVFEYKQKKSTFVFYSIYFFCKAKSLHHLWRKGEWKVFKKVLSFRDVKSIQQSRSTSKCFT